MNSAYTVQMSHKASYLSIINIREIPVLTYCQINSVLKFVTMQLIAVIYHDLYIRTINVSNLYVHSCF